MTRVVERCPAYQLNPGFEVCSTFTWEMWQFMYANCLNNILWRSVQSVCSLVRCVDSGQSFYRLKITRITRSIKGHNVVSLPSLLRGVSIHHFHVRGKRARKKRRKTNSQSRFKKKNTFFCSQDLLLTTCNWITDGTFSITKWSPN